MTAIADPIEQPDLAFLDPGDGRKIAMRVREPKAGQPTVLFLPGYASDMDGTKAVSIDKFCALQGLGCARLDYSGTGSSGGEFAAATLHGWRDEAIYLADLAVPRGPLVVVGSSMGGWLALHLALARPARVKGLLGIAAAPDFTDWGYSDDDKAAIKAAGKVERPNPYGPEPSVTHFPLWQSGAGMRNLTAPIDLPIPVRLIHGTADAEVPMWVPQRLMEKLHSSDVQLRLIKGAGHRLSEPHEIHAILVELHGLVELAR